MAALPPILISKPVAFKDNIQVKEESALIQAADQGDIKTLTELVTIENVNTPASNGLAPIFFAAAGGHKDAVALLIKKGAQFNIAVEVDGEKPSYKYTNCKGEDIYYRKGDTVLMMATVSGIETFTYLVETEKANTSQTNAFDQAVLHVAAENGNLTVIKYILETLAKTETERKALSEKRAKDGSTPFVLARHLSVVRYFVETMKVDVSQANDNGSTILHLMWGDERVEVLEYLLETRPYARTKSKVLLEKRDNEGCTPFLTIDIHDKGGVNLKVVRYFVEKFKVNMQQTNTAGETLLHIASRTENQLDVIRYILETYAKTKAEKKALLDKQDKEGDTPFLAIGNGNRGVLEHLKYYVETLKVDILQSNSAKETILHIISRRCLGEFSAQKEACLNYFLKEYPKTSETRAKLEVALEKKDARNNTPYFAAVENGVINLVRCYLESGRVGIMQKNNIGRTALHVAGANNNLDMMKYLVEIAAKTEEERSKLIEAQDNDEETAFVVSAYHGHKLPTQYLLSKGARLPNGYQTYSSLASKVDFTYAPEFLQMLTAASNLLALVKGSVSTPSLSELLTAGASLNQRVSDGSTILHWVASRGDETLLEIILDEGVDILSQVNDRHQTAKQMAETHGQMGVVARILIREIKVFLSQNEGNREVLKKHEKEIDEKIRQIFEVAEKVTDANKKAALNLSLGLQFKELQLVSAAKRAFTNIPETSGKVFNSAQEELLQYPVDPIIPSISLEVEDDRKKTQENDKQRRLLTQLRIGYDATLPTILSKDTSALRTRYFNDFLGVSMQAPKPGAAAATPYPDPCTTFGLMYLTKAHAAILDKYQALTRIIKKQAEDNNTLRRENETLKTTNNTLESVLDRFLPKKRKHEEILEEMKDPKAETPKADLKETREVTAASKPFVPGPAILTAFSATPDTAAAASASSSLNSSNSNSNSNSTISLSNSGNTNSVEPLNISTPVRSTTEPERKKQKFQP